MSRLRYLIVLALAFAGLGIGATAGPASAQCIDDPINEGRCLPCPDFSKYGIYCTD